MPKYNVGDHVKIINPGFLEYEWVGKVVMFVGTGESDYDELKIELFDTGHEVFFLSVDVKPVPENETIEELVQRYNEAEERKNEAERERAELQKRIIDRFPPLNDENMENDND